MEFHLPEYGQKAIPLPHFPTRQQAFLFRAFEYIPPVKIAEILDTTVDTVLQAAADMGLKNPCDSDIWLKKGYITIIRSLWHILPYEQLTALLEMDDATLARLLREEDFLDVKLAKKPVCAPVKWQPLTPQEQTQTAQIRQVMEKVCMDGAKPFDFHYSAEPIAFSGAEHFKTRMVYGFSSLYQSALDNDSRSFCPDDMLLTYRNQGVNALWIPGTLFSLAPFPYDEKLAAGYEKRLAYLKNFAERCDAFGIELFLYLNEPRSLPEAFYEKYPYLKGHKRNAEQVCLCTSTPEVQTYLRDSVALICKSAPKLGGIFTITRSEYVTNCYSHSGKKNMPECNCPRCSKRTPGEVIAEVVGCIAQGAHSVNPDFKVIAWSWSWGDDHLDIINHLPQDVILMSNSEDLKEFTIGGVSGRVRDYSMSIVGPGKKAKAEWAAAKARGLEIAAKVQINTTWECSTVPAIPVYPLVEEHMQNLRKEGIKHLMLSWTLGGYPSNNIRYAAKYFYDSCTPAIVETEKQRQATMLFSQAFREFPFDIGVLYRGPENGGVSNLLFTEPTGYKATMTCYAYDDLDSWRSIYPEDVFEDQFAKLCDKWQEGMALLEDDGSELYLMAAAADCQFRACLNQIRFYRARAIGDQVTMKAMAEAELHNAEAMLTLMNRTPVLGFEAANHYYYSKGNIAEKILNCKDILQNFG